MELTKVLQSPVVTEKSTSAQTQRKYTFLVHLNANKIEVKNAIEKSYGVKVDSVNIVPVLQKTRLVGRGKTMTKRSRAKKAIVSLMPKNAIDFNKIK